MKSQLKQIGFKNVYQELNDVQIKEILADSDLVFNDQESSDDNSELDSSCNESGDDEIEAEEDDDDDDESEEEDESGIIME